jgi:oligosaccharide repeat unit polymerase
VRGKARIPLELLFSPVTLALALYLPLLGLFVVTSPAVFTDEFNVEKSSSLAGLAYLAIAIVVFVFGAVAGMRRTPGRRSVDVGAVAVEGDLAETALRLLRVSLLIAIAAYLVWFAHGVVLAGGVGSLVHLWLQNPEDVKANILKTIPGVTTLTQLAVAAIPLLLAFRLRSRRGITALITVVFVLAIVRSFAFSERLALLELLVPVVYLVLAPRVVEVHKAVLVALAAGLAVLVLFAVTEARRSFVYTQNLSAGHVTARFFGYYLTSENNAIVVVQHYPGATPFANTGQMLWDFPLVKHLRVPNVPLVGTLALDYPDLFGRDPATFWPDVFPDQGLSYEYNVFTTPGFLAADFGWLGLVGVGLLGLVSGSLYRRARSSPFHRAFYAVWLIGLLEFMRIMYFFDTRALPAYLLFGLVYLLLRRRAGILDWRTVRSRQPESRTAPVEAAARAG